MSEDTAPPRVDPAQPREGKYDSSAVVGAVILTLIAPLIALVVALVLRSSQNAEAKRKQLESWAVASGFFLILAPIVGVALFLSLARSPTPTKGICQGGPIPGADGTPVGGNRYRFPCVGGGSMVMHFPDGSPKP